jgi:hypothetical protein
MGGPHNFSGQHISPRPYGSMSSVSNSKPHPPPPPSEQQRQGPWNLTSKEARHSNSRFGGSRSPAPSECSDGTMAGSDFGSEKPAGGDQDTSTIAPHLHRSDSSFSRKRGCEDAEQDDHTKRKRRSLVDAAYR